MSENALIGVVLVDDHPIVRAGLRTLLSQDARIHVMGEAASSAEAVTVVGALVRRGTPPDLVLMDLQLGDGPSGIDTTRMLLTEHDLKVLVLTTFDTDSDISAALAAGATGYVLKDAPTAELVDAVIAVAAGRTSFSRDVSERLSSRTPARELTTRETEILQLLGQGRTNRDIAKALFLSESTIKGHLVSLYDKLGVDNRTSALAEARRLRLIR